MYSAFQTPIEQLLAFHLCGELNILSLNLSDRMVDLRPIKQKMVPAGGIEPTA
jgi:hypothetical protein